MIFNLYSKLKKNILLKKFKNINLIKKKNIKKLKFIKFFNILLKSKNSNLYLYNKIYYKYKNIKLIYLISNKYNLIFLKLLNIWYLLLNYKINYNLYYINIIKYIFINF
nr:hypothetical protein [Haemoproteus columbae]